MIQQWAYFDKGFNERVSKLPKVFPCERFGNLLIHVTGQGASKDFSALITNSLPEYLLQANGQGFPQFLYEEPKMLGGLFDTEISDDYSKRENISDATLAYLRENYDSGITKEDIFYYAYGILHSPEYRHRFQSDLRKRQPRIPLAHDFWAFSKAGHELAQWHLNYEAVEPYLLEELSSRLGLNPKEDYQVQKMTFGRRGKEIDKTTIVYNSNVRLSGIPLETYEYVVNGKSALEWVMERYQVTKDRDSQIINDPNDWSDDPRYIIDLVKRIVRVSLESVRIVKGLPDLNEHKQEREFVTSAAQAG